MNELKNRVMGRLHDLNKSSADLARGVGVNPQNVQHWYRRESIPGSFVVAVARELDCSAEWLLTGKGEIYGLTGVVNPRDQNAFIPYYHDPDKQLSMPKVLVEPYVSNVDNCCLFDIRDNSMSPILRAGGLAIVDISSEEPMDGEIMLVEIGGAHPRLRRVSLRASGGVLLSAESKEARYPDDEIPPEHIDNVRWCGVVRVGCGSV